MAHEQYAASLPQFAAEPIRTERLVLRQWIESDREGFAALNGDEAVMEYFPSTYSREASDAAVGRYSAGIAARGWGLWAVEHDGEFIGFTGLSVPSFDAPFLPGVEIGWRLARSAWGNGFATEAARASVSVAFERLGLDELLSFTAVQNQRSRSVMAKLGMTTDAAENFDHPLVANGHPLRRHVLYRLARRS